MRRNCNAHRANVFAKFMIYDAQSLSIYNEGTQNRRSAFLRKTKAPSFSAQGLLLLVRSQFGVGQATFVVCLSDTSLVSDKLYLFLLFRTIGMTLQNVRPSQTK